MHHRDRVVSQAELTEHIYAQSFDRDSNTVEVFIARLRQEARRRASSRPCAASAIASAGRRHEHAVVAARPPAARRGAVDDRPVLPGHRAVARDARQPAPAAADARSSSTTPPWWRCSALVCLIAGLLAGAARLVADQPAARPARAPATPARERRLDGEYPSEVEPLVGDLNALLDQRERSLARARAKAGDLAHGLKTPLAVLVQEAERADAAGQPDLGDAIRAAGRADAAAGGLPAGAGPRRRVGRRPGRARATSVPRRPTASRARCARLHAERGVTIEVDGRRRPAGARRARGSRRDARQPARQRLQVGPQRAPCCRRRATAIASS